MSGFADLGLSEPLVAAAAALGWDQPLPVQRAAVPVLRRGGNAVLRASRGAGVTGAYGLGLLDRLAASETGAGPRALVIVPTDARAADVATVLGRLAAGSMSTAALSRGWKDPAEAAVVVGTPLAVGHALGTSALKVGDVEALVLENAEALLVPETASALDTLLVSVPAGAQRVVAAATLTRELERFVEAHVRRAMTIPPRPADAAKTPPGAPAGTVSYVVVPAAKKEAALARLLDDEGARTVAVRGPRSADVVNELVRVRGYGNVDVVSFAGGGATGAAVAFDVPPDADSLRSLDAERATVLVEPGELPHLRATAADANLELRARPPQPDDADRLAGYRDEVRRALREEDLDAQLLVLDPLFDEASAAEVAAALSALVRRRAPAPQAREAREPSASAPGAPPRPRPFVRLFVGVGQKDGVRPADIVGSFTGEAGIAGEQVGRIEIRDTFSVVEVDPGVADRIIRALNGTTMRGRSVRVDYDRKSPAPQQRRRTRPS